MARGTCRLCALEGSRGKRIRGYAFNFMGGFLKFRGLVNGRNDRCTATSHGQQATVSGTPRETIYLSDIPPPDALGQIRWFCALCVIAKRVGGPLASPVSVVIKSQRIPGGWVDVPLCACHLAHHTFEERRAAVLLMYTERLFKAKWGGPLIDDDFAALIFNDDVN